MKSNAKATAGAASWALRRLAASVVFGLFATGAWAQGTADPPRAAAERTERLDEMKGLVQDLKAFQIEQGKRIEAELVPEPLQRWNDPTRAFSDGSLWVWGRRGRPIAAVAVELYPSEQYGATWSHEFSSLSTGLLEVDGGLSFNASSPGPAPRRRDGTFVWAPQKPGLSFHEIPGAPAPLATEAGRLRQIKDLVRRFSGNEVYHRNQQTYELRLLPQPVHRYADAPAGLLDGAVFILANGTNPEILILIEAQNAANGPAAWRYAIAPMSWSTLHVKLDQTVVFSLDRVTPLTSDMVYYNAWKPRDRREPVVGKP